MIPWNSIDDVPMPRDRMILAIWKGQYCIAEFDKEEDHWWICWMPYTYELRWPIKDEAVLNFTHWSELTLPADY